MSSNTAPVYLFGSYARDLYRENNLQILALPDGLTRQYRYNKEWVPDSIWIEPESIQDSEAIVVSTFKNEEDEDYFDFHPIRKGKILSAEQQNGMLIIIFELLPEWADYSDEEYHENIKKLDYRPIDRENGYFISQDTSGKIAPTEIKWSGVEKWSKIIEKISSKEETNEVFFYRVNGIKQGEDTINLSGERGNKRFNLLSGGNYSLEVIFRRGEMDKRTEVNAAGSHFRIQSRDGNFTIYPQETRLGFRSDRKLYDLTCDKVMSNKKDEIQMDINGIDGIHGASIKLPIVVNKRYRIHMMYIVLFFGIFLATGLGQYWMTGDLGTLLPTSLGSVIVTILLWYIASYKR
ncbi:hypothetical protein [Natrinema hispanicum]|uniref:Uncharacterized protein n=1 Tax=Natrinema hispanicum TaxID=392421 RepID=A0A1G6VNE2_9EURY|nr:hypothetical protein [Natrinema hispanicum]SDD55108.1 hypothetical protein SAMN05192552_103011 [Natrinema hispanicum]